MCFWVRIFVYHCLTCWMSFSGLQLPTWLDLLVMASVTRDDLCCESSHVENCLNELIPGVFFTFINHYLWNPQPLLVQYIEHINKFLWLSVFWLLFKCTWTCTHERNPFEITWYVCCWYFTDICNISTDLWPTLVFTFVYATHCPCTSNYQPLPLRSGDFLWVPSNYLLKFFSSPCGYLFNAFWISYEVLMMLVNFWSRL